MLTLTMDAAPSMQGPLWPTAAPQLLHREPHKHTGNREPHNQEKRKWNFRWRRDGLHRWGIGHGFFTKLLFAISGLLKKKVIKMLAAASVCCQEQSWIWLLCTGHDYTSPTPFTKMPACSGGERVFGVSYALFSQSGISYASGPWVRSSGFKNSKTLCISYTAWGWVFLFKWYYKMGR